jgi:hypothetical protein
MTPIIACIALSAALLPCCSTRKAGIPKDDGCAVKYFRDAPYDGYGMPVFKGELKAAPEKEGAQYLAVLFSGGRPVRYYSVGITRCKEKPDLRRPLKVIYQWTGRGFELGYEYSRDIIEDSAETASNAGDRGCASAFAVPGMALGSAIFIATSAGGFVVGIHDSVPASVEEIKKLGIKKQEVILGYSVIERDNSGRMARIISFSPPPDEAKLSETGFFYEGDASTPSRAVNYSVPEKRTRVIYPQH